MESPSRHESSMDRMSQNVQEAMHILANEYDLPGPFTVLQGTPGDGMANSIDTMPNYIEAPSSDSENSSDDDESCLDPVVEAQRRNDPIGHDLVKDCKTCDIPRQIHNAIECDMKNHSMNKLGSNSNRKRRQNPDIENEDVQSHVDSSFARGAVPPAHDLLSNVHTATPPRKPLYMSPRRDDQPKIGLHLPLPPGIPSIGFNSILPPIEVQLSPRVPASDEDSFIMVDDAKKGATRDSFPSSPGSLVSSGASSEGRKSPCLLTDLPSSSGELSSCESIHHFKHKSISSQHKNAIDEWNQKCREDELLQLKEVLMHSASPGISVENASGASMLYGNQWWKSKRHFLRVFDSPPKFLQKYVSNKMKDVVQLGEVVGDLAPGTTVMGVEKFVIVNEHVVKQDRQSRESQNVKEGTIEILKIESPIHGYVVYSVDGYPLIGPGLPSNYAEPDVWFWRVTCTRGAFVRQGLELTSVHIATIPFGAFVRVKRKTINAMGLSRLQIEAILTEDDSALDVPESPKSGGFTNALLSLSLRKNSSQNSQDCKVRKKKITGWISESLNPLSGQTGPIVQPISLPVPALCRVILSDGAVIRQGVELSSSQIGHAPFGAVLSIVGRAYSQHPMDKCIQRLKLAGGGGWISVKLNRPPPGDNLHVIEQIGIDGSFDPKNAGFFHIEMRSHVLSECDANTPSPDDAVKRNIATVRSSLQRLGSSCISSINDEEDSCSTSSSNDGVLNSSVLPALYRSGVADFGRTSSQISLKCGSKSRRDDLCLICLTEERNATIVHGETGHIACCLTCARLLKGRGDKCPVCRLPIDMIIQQFWA